MKALRQRIIPLNAERMVVTKGAINLGSWVCFKSVLLAQELGHTRSGHRSAPFPTFASINWLASQRFLGTVVTPNLR
jgi:hypothetical protein